MRAILEALGLSALFLVLALLWFAVMSGRLHANESYAASVMITQESSLDVHDIQHFHLGVQGSGRATIAIDGDTDLAAALRRLSGQRVMLSLQPAQRLER